MASANDMVSWSEQSLLPLHVQFPKMEECSVIALWARLCKWYQVFVFSAILTQDLAIKRL